MRWVLTAVVMAALSVLLALPAEARRQTFFGEDEGSGESTALSSTSNSDDARDDFLDWLTDYDSEGFESETVPSRGYVFSTTPTITLENDAELTGRGRLREQGSTIQNGRYAVGGTKFFESIGPFKITFEEEISAFGFYGIDVGDFAGVLSITTENEDGDTRFFSVDHSTDGDGGDVLFWGLVDTSQPFLSVTFQMTLASSTSTGSVAPLNTSLYDAFAIDNLIYGTADTSNVPEPASFVLLGLPVAGLILLRRRRFRRSQARPDAQL